MQPGLSFPTWFQVAIINRRGHTFLGDIGIHFFDEGRQVELGFTLSSSHQRNGYSFEALSELDEFSYALLKEESQST